MNLASRIEGVNRIYGTRVLLNGETRRLAGTAIETPRGRPNRGQGQDRGCRGTWSSWVPGARRPWRFLPCAIATRKASPPIDGSTGSLPRLRCGGYWKPESGTRSVEGPAHSHRPDGGNPPPAAGWDGVWYLAQK